MLFSTLKKINKKKTLGETEGACVALRFVAFIRLSIKNDSIWIAKVFFQACMHPVHFPQSHTPRRSSLAAGFIRRNQDIDCLTAQLL